jgi:uncharacterized protein (DUF1684 family)
VSCVVLTLVLASPTINGQTDAYGIAQAEWRMQREVNLRADNSWLTMAALYFLREGANSFGASPLNDLVLPEGPDSAGVFELRNREVFLRTPNGQTLSVNGEPVTSTQLYPTEDRRRNITIGDLTMWVHYSGDRLAIRVSDNNSEIRTSFTGLKWFPVDEDYQVRGRFVPHDEPITVQLPNILGDIEPFTSHGSVVLTVNGQEMKMLPMTSGDRLWFIFRDLTSGSETYSAARFLYADAPDEDGWTTVDFNQAYNPPCAFNPHTTCPLPPEPNRLGVRVEAGEKKYH